ncbi:unnamed protein product [Medioppia subpectinata]|uniref:Tudor domain-containing protein n=1 Tax=Medioppia subpectinata TaxID=1979941 RepID=A0A7R9KQC0_9ACAR|nr:unnamed protein product [Medioppia subpectinata]CAG2107582.1 unnamed protein product [Medioppia subpectinata]
MDSIGKKLLLSAGIGLGVAVSSVSLYLLLKPEDEDNVVVNESDKRKVRQNTQSMVSIRVPKKCVGAVIGRSGEHIKQIQSETNTKINFDDMNGDQNGHKDSRLLLIKGTPENTAKAEIAINEIIRHQSLIKTKTFVVETVSVGAIIGRNGSTIRSLCDTSGAKIKVDRKNSMGRNTNAITTSVTIIGTEEQIKEAVLLINHEIKQNDSFNRNSNTQKRLTNYKVLAIEGEGDDNNTLDLDSYYAKLEPINDQLIEVFVSSIKSPDKFYVQLAGPGAQELDHFMEEVTDFYENQDNRICFKPLSVKVGDVMAVPYHADEHWYRARVLSLEDRPYSLEDSNVGIFYLDYGDEALVKYSQICDLKDQLLKRLPFQAMECSLSGIRPVNHTNWSDEAIDKFKELSHMALWKPLFARLIRRTNDGKTKYVIELIDNKPDLDRIDNGVNGSNDDDWDTPAVKPLNISQELIAQGFAIPFEEELSD